MARICAAADGGAAGTAAGQPRVGSGVGGLAPAAVLDSAGGYLRAVVSVLRCGGRCDVGGARLALGKDRREPAASHAAARGREQLQGHCALGGTGRGARVRIEPFASCMAHGGGAVGMCGVLSGADAENAPGPSRLSRGQLVKIFDLREYGAVETLHLGVGRFDDEIFVRGMGAVPVSEAEVAGGEAERIAGEDAPGPRAGQARPEYGL